MTSVYRGQRPHRWAAARAEFALGKAGVSDPPVDWIGLHRQWEAVNDLSCGFRRVRNVYVGPRKGAPRDIYGGDVRRHKCTTANGTFYRVYGSRQQGRDESDSDSDSESRHYNIAGEGKERKEIRERGDHKPQW